MIFTARGRAAAVLACLSTFLVGCDSATEPGQRDGTELTDTTSRITIQVEVTTTSATFRQHEIGSKLECVVALGATATGTEGVKASWVSAELRLFGGSKGTTLLQIQHLSPDKIHEAWPTPEIVAGETQQGELRLLEDEPFTVRGKLRYREQAGTLLRIADFEGSCNPGSSYDGGAEPWIRDIYIEPASEEIEPGHDQSLKITYTAVPGSGGLGIRETGVRVSGSLSEVRRRVEAAPMGRVRATHSFGVGTTADIGKPVRIQVYSIDAGGREIATSWIDGPMVVDSTPPQVVEAYLERVFPRQGERARLSGRYATSDTMRLSIWAGDNHRLGHIVYTLGPPANVRDSVEYTFGLSDIAIPVRDEWLGAESFSMYVRDAAGLKSTEYVSPPDSFHIYPVRPRPTRSGELAGAFSDLALDPIRDRIYLAQPEAQSIAIVPLGDLSASTRVELAGSPRPTSLDLAPDGNALVVALRWQRALAFIDPTDLEAAPTLVALTALAESYHPAAVRYLPTGRILVQMSGERHTLFLEYDPATGAQTVRPDTIPFISDHNASTARTPDYRWTGFGVSEECTVVYDAVADRFTACRRLQYGRSISVADDGSRFAKAAAVYGASLDQVWQHHPLYFRSYTSGIAPDGKELYLSGDRGLIRVRLEDGAFVDRTPLAPAYNGRIIFARGGRLLLAVGGEPEVNAERTRIDAVDLN